MAPQFGEEYLVPVREALELNASAIDLDRLLLGLQEAFGDAVDDDASGDAGMRIALWWDRSNYSRRRYGTA